MATRKPGWTGSAGRQSGGALARNRDRNSWGQRQGPARRRALWEDAPAAEVPWDEEDDASAATGDALSSGSTDANERPSGTPAGKPARGWGSRTGADHAQTRGGAQAADRHDAEPSHEGFGASAGWSQGRREARVESPSAARRPDFGFPRKRAADRDRETRQALTHLQVNGSELWETYRRLSALSRDLQQILPSIRLQPLKLERQVLVVTAASSAMAARLRQYEPRLVDGLQARGWLVTRIRFKPTTFRIPEPPPRQPKAPVPESALAAMEKLANTPKTSKRLREVLQDFVARQRNDWRS